MPAMKTETAYGTKREAERVKRLNYNPRVETKVKRNERIEVMFRMYCELQGRQGCITDIAQYFGISVPAVSKLAKRHRWQDRFDESRDKFLSEANKISLRAFEMHMAVVDAILLKVFNQMLEGGVDPTPENAEKLLTIRERVSKISEGKTDDPESSKLVGAVTNITNYFRDIPEPQRQQLDTDVANMLLARRGAGNCVPEPSL